MVTFPYTLLHTTSRGNPSQGIRPDDRSLSWLADPGEFGQPVSRGGGPAANCLAAVVRGTLKGPGRRIGQRGDATRAPSQGPRPERAARCRSPAFRDWPQSDKSIHNFACHRLAREPTFSLPLTPRQSSFAVAPAQQSRPSSSSGSLLPPTLPGASYLCVLRLTLALRSRRLLRRVADSLADAAE